MSLPQRITSVFGSVFGVRPDESERMVVLLGSSFFLGLCLVFFNTASNAIFLTEFKAEGLPYVYIVNAILVAVSGYVYSLIQRRAAFIGLFYGTVALLTLSIFAFRVGYWLTASPWLTFGLMTWYRQLLVFGMLGQWNLASYLFDVRQAKRLFALVYLGTMSAIAVGGLATATIVGVIGTVNLLLVSGSSLLIYLLILVANLPRFERKLTVVPQNDANGNYSQLLRNRYIVLIFLLRTASIVGSYLIEYLFYKQANLIFPDAQSLAGFLGSFVGASTLLMVIVAALLSGRFIARYGLKIAVPLTPTLLTLLAVAVSVISTLRGTGGGEFFLLVASMLLFSDVLQKSLATPLLSVLYQSLPADLRSRVRTASESVIGSGAVVLSGVLLLALIRDVSTITFVYLLLATLAVWAVIAVLAYQQYAATLKRTVSRRFLHGVALSTNELPGAQSLANRMQTMYPGEITASLSLLDQEATGDLVLLDLLKHPDPRVQRAVLERIEHSHFTPALFEVRHLAVQRDTSDPVRVAAFSAWCALDPDYAPEAIAAYLDEPDLTVQAGAIATVLRYATGDIRAMATSRLGTLVNSMEASKRVLAAHIIGEVGSVNTALDDLFTDPSLEVRRAAIAAAGKVNHPTLWATLLGMLNNAALRSSAVAALGKADETLIPQIQAAYDTAIYPVPLSLIHVCGAIGGSQAAAFLESLLDSVDNKIRAAALAALYQCGYQADQESIVANVTAEVACAIDILRATIDIDADMNSEAESLIGRALADELDQVRRNIFSLLTLAYEPGVILGAQQNLSHRLEDKRSYALETLDILLSAPLKKLLFPLVEDLTPSQRLDQLDATHSGKSLSKLERLSTLPDQPWASSWTRACAVYALGQWISPASLTEVTEADYRAILLTIEKVLALRAVSIFARTSDDVLAEIALALKEQTAQVGVTIVHKGEIGTSMYIIMAGQVRVHDGEQTLATLHERDIFGELAVLDAEPRSASVTATGDSQLLCLDQEALYELMVNRVEIVQGILRVLCQRVRTQTQRVIQGQP